MSLKLIIGSRLAYYTYDSRQHRLVARCLSRGTVHTIVGRHLGEIKNRLLVIDTPTSREVFTIATPRSV